MRLVGGALIVVALFFGSSLLTMDAAATAPTTDVAPTPPAASTESTDKPAEPSEKSEVFTVISEEQLQKINQVFLALKLYNQALEQKIEEIEEKDRRVRKKD